MSLSPDIQKRVDELEAQYGPAKTQSNLDYKAWREALEARQPLFRTQSLALKAFQADPTEETAGAYKAASNALAAYEIVMHAKQEVSGASSRLETELLAKLQSLGKLRGAALRAMATSKPDTNIRNLLLVGAGYEGHTEEVHQFYLAAKEAEKHGWEPMDAIVGYETWTERFPLK